MPIVKAEAVHLPTLQRLLAHAPYRYMDMGREDIPGLLTHATVVGEDQGALWGALGVQVETRPQTLPPDAPTRAHIRAVALTRGRQPARDLGLLLAAALAQADASPDASAGGTPHPARQVVCYGAERWLYNALIAAGFVHEESVQFFELDRLHSRLAELPPDPPQVTLTAGRPDILGDLAQLDGVTFPPLWHFGRRDLFEMLMRCRMQVAWMGDALAGYSALCANSDHEVQLARLAVAPAFQRHGVARALLADAVRYAAASYDTLVLNTQSSNGRSQKLYRGFGFRPTGVSVPVLTRSDPPPPPQLQR